MASPTAKAAAQYLGIDLAIVPGTGGILKAITKEDVFEFAKNLLL